MNPGLIVTHSHIVGFSYLTAQVIIPSPKEEAAKIVFSVAVHGTFLLP